MTMAPNQSSNGWKKGVLIFLVIFILLSPLVRLANLSILAGASLTVLFSAFFLLFARSNSPKGTRIFRAQGIIALLLVSLLCAIPGLVLIHYSGYLHRRLLRDGILITFGGMLLGPVIFSVVANCLLKGEKKHLQEDLAKKLARVPSLQRKIRARSSVVRMKNHPSIPILFCLVSWIVGIAMVMGGLFGDQSVGLILLGAFISLAYTCALGMIFVTILRGKWDSYFDAAIEKVDWEIKQIQEKTPDPNEQRLPEKSA
jgi:hypothetical protein